MIALKDSDVNYGSLKYTRAFAQAWRESEFVQEVPAQLPWHHRLAQIDRAKNQERGNPI